MRVKNCFYMLFKWMCVKNFLHAIHESLFLFKDYLRVKILKIINILQISDGKL